MREVLTDVDSLLASIFTTDTAVQEQNLSQMLDYMNAYRVIDISLVSRILWYSRLSPQKYTVYRKMPMLVTRSARMLAIDGGYIHVSILLPFPSFNLLIRAT